MTHISIADRMPTLDFTPNALKDGIGVVPLILMAGFADTSLAAGELVASGAVRIEGRPITDPDHHILSYAFDDGEVLRLTVGAKSTMLIRRAD
ncbi:tyrosyl-tRNA synthetase [Thalassospira sp.]|uniref:tyrosyl-tRNA synthetase n=1 Tax=Thalassospira sp. TaxID=1912094 RepID=UPI000C6A8B81|nr:tyrosyl-tRNA synthetase [Thalassospira sp.]MBC06878.1 tyrosyl-tRNA synthetase [Thalassospira sp.]|tara:strand:+ start:518 stop:796 length:279 start_codon:yes stop_codon:yes gene_type:complete